MRIGSNVGTDQVDGLAWAERDIIVRNGDRYGKPLVVQITWALILELSCQPQEWRRRVRAGD